MRAIDIAMSESPEAPEIETDYIHLAECGVKTESPFETRQMTRRRKVVQVIKH